MTHEKTHAKNFDPHKNIFDACNPHKKLIHTNHGPTDPRNPQTHVMTVTMQPMRFSRLFILMFPSR